MRVAPIVLVLLVSAGLTLSSVYGWSNGPSGHAYSSNPAVPEYGTHDWIANHALDWLPTSEQQFFLGNLSIYLFGTELPDNSKAVDGKGIGDTVLHHVYYNATGALENNASAKRAQAMYDKAVTEYEAGNISDALEHLGAMTHYIDDVGVFGHVMGKGTDWGEEGNHSDYEEYVNRRTSNYTDGEFTSFLVFDGILENISAYDATVKLAYNTTFGDNGNYNCTWMDANYNWSDPIFKNRCGESLNLATNWVADVLHTFRARTRLVGDINGDGRVDMKDISTIAKHFNSSPSRPDWDSSLDINSDDRIDMKDIAVAARHFGEHYP